MSKEYNTKCRAFPKYFIYKNNHSTILHLHVFPIIGIWHRALTKNKYFPQKTKKGSAIGFKIEIGNIEQSFSKKKQALNLTLSSGPLVSLFKFVQGRGV